MVRNRVEKLVLDIVLSYADDDGGEDLNSDSILDVDDLALLWQNFEGSGIFGIPSDHFA